MSSPENFKTRWQIDFAFVDKNRTAGVSFFCLSVLVHGLFFGGLIFFQDFRILKPLPPVIQIDLVSFAPEPLVEEAGKNQEESKQEGVPEKVTPVEEKTKEIPAIRPEIGLKTKPKNLKEIMAEQKEKEKEPEKKKEKKPAVKEKPKKEVDPDKALEEARQKMERKIEDQNKDMIAQALSRMQKKVNVQGDKKEGEAKGGDAGTGKKGYKPLDLYKMVLGNAIEQNWVFNDILAGMDQNLETRILIKILKSGEIRDIIYETKSGNRYLDESAKKAISKSNPLPQLPPGMHSYDVVVIFTPKGLK